RARRGRLQRKNRCDAARRSVPEHAVRPALRCPPQDGGDRSAGCMSATIIKDTKYAGLDALIHRLAAGAERVMVGVPVGAKEDDGTAIALIAAVHEFGSPKKGIPERSFLRAGIRRAQPQLAAVNFDSLRKVVDNTMSIHQALDRLGLAASTAVKEEINRGDFTPLAEETIRRKGSD